MSAIICLKAVDVHDCFFYLSGFAVTKVCILKSRLEAAVEVVVGIPITNVQIKQEASMYTVSSILIHVITIGIWLVEV